MGGFARVAAPIAVSLAAPYALAGMGLSIPGMTAAAPFNSLTNGFTNMLTGFNGVATVYQPVFSWGNLISAGLSGINSALSYQQQGYAEYQAAQQRNAQLTAMYQAQAQQEQQRQDRLRRLTASQRAAYGAMGLDADAGSGQALIEGLMKKEDQDAAYRRDELLRKSQDLLEASHPKNQFGFDFFINALAPTVRLLREQ